MVLFALTYEDLMSTRIRSITTEDDQLPVELVEALSDLLASMLVDEWKAQRSQSVTEFTVSSPPQTNRRFLQHTSSMLVDSARKADRSDTAEKASPISVRKAQ